MAPATLSPQNVIPTPASDPTATQPDAGQSPLNVGVLTIARGGFPLRALTVNLALNGPGPGLAVEGVDHASLPRSVYLPAGVSYQTISVTPMANTNRLTSVIATMKLLAGSGYSVGMASNASVVIYPSTTATGTGLTGQYYTNANASYSNSANFNPANLRLTRIDTNIAFVWTSSS